MDFDQYLFQQNPEKLILFVWDHDHQALLQSQNLQLPELDFDFGHHDQILNLEILPPYLRPKAERVTFVIRLVRIALNPQVELASANSEFELEVERNLKFDLLDLA